MTGQDRDPEPGRVATQQDFGRELSRARQRAGLTVREVARAAGLPASTAGDYFSGRHLPPPTQPGLLLEILRACGEDDPGRLQEWTSALARARRAPGRRAAGAVAPYRGLASFQRGDARWFFGRADVTRRLVALATEAAPGGTGLPVAVVGPSGSGKSSLLRAGLIPHLLGLPAPGTTEPGTTGPETTEPGIADTGGTADTASRPVVLFSPTAHPLTALATQLSRLTPGRAASDIEAALRADAPRAQVALPGPAGRAIIVVDQFEAIFTECRADDERQAFLTAICALSGRAVVALALRADFYDRALRYPQLTGALQERQVVLGPMSSAQVRDAIVEPARLAHLDVEEGLVEVMLRDLAPRVTAGSPAETAHEPGALPLLSHALLATWEHSRGSRLTVADYQATGGIREAIARTAETVYAGLPGDQQEAARRLFLRLVHVADDAPETRSTHRLSELTGTPDGAIPDSAMPDSSAPDGAAPDSAVPDSAAPDSAPPGSAPPDSASPASDLLGRFVDARLITTDAGTAQITHDALLTAWPRLRGWIDADRENLRIRRRIDDAAQAWADASRDQAALLRGTQLAVASDWAADAGNRESLNRQAREFVDLSADQEKLRHQAERNRTRRLRRLVAALTVLVLATCGLAAFAFDQRQDANAARDSATVARDNADSREVAIEADQARSQNVSLASQLSLAAYRISPTSEARSSLLETSGTAAAARLADSSGTVQAVGLSPDHRVLAVPASDGTLRLWNVARTGHPVALGPALLPVSKYPLYTAAFSPGGRLLAAGGAAKTVLLWNVSDPAHPVRIGGPLTGFGSTVYSVAFSPDGQVLAAGSADDTIRLWNVTDPGRPRLLARLTGPAGYVESVAFSPDGRTLAAGSADMKVWLWDVASPAHPVRLGKPLTGPGKMVSSVAFSPDGKLLAAGSEDDKVWLWNVTRPARPVPDGPPLTGATDWVNAVSFSPDGATLAAGTSDASVLTWNVASRALTGVLPHPLPVTSLAWDRAGQLITGAADGTVRTWHLPPPVLTTGTSVNSVAVAADGTTLAVGGQGGQELQLWNPVSHQELAAAKAPGALVNDVALAPGGKLLAAAYGDGMIQLWSATAPLVPLGKPVLAAVNDTFTVEDVAFSPNGTILASSSADGTVRLWSVSNPARPRLLAIVPDSATKSTATAVYSVAFSPDGRILAAGSGDNLTRLWDIASPAKPTLIGKPLGGPTSYVFSVAFSPDGATLAVGSGDKTIRLWNVSRPARPRRLGYVITGPASYVYDLEFSPDGRTLAAGVTDGTVWLWHVAHAARPTLAATLTGPAGHVYSIAFSPDGGTLAAGSADGTVWLWDTRARAAAAAVCATAGQPLTRHEWRTYVPGLPYRPPCPA